MMNSSRRWLGVFAAVVGLLVILAVVFVTATNGQKVALLDENTPQGIVQRYLLALKDTDYSKAYNYLSFNPSDKISTYDDWLTSNVSPYSYNQTTWKATLGKIDQNGNNATVDVTVDTFRQGGVFSNSQSSQQLIFILTKNGNSWLITSPTYLYWMF
jgi:hypothetical protein